MIRSFAALSLFCSPTLAAAADVTVTVSSSGGGDYASIADAVAGTNADDNVTVKVMPGIYPHTVISRAGAITIEPASALSKSTLTGIEIKDAGADVTLRQVNIKGGGAKVARGALTLEEMSIHDSDGEGHAAIEAASDTTLTMDTVLIENWSGSSAPIMVDQDATAILDTVGVFHSEGEQTGALWSRNANLTISGLFTSNTTGGSSAGAVHIHGGVATISESQFIRATGTLGGGLRMTGNARVTATDVGFEENESMEGGHIRMESGRLELTRSTATEGSAERGAVFWQGGGSADIRNAAWEGNHALIAGAAVYQQAGTLAASFGTFTRMASGGAVNAHTGGGTATYTGVIIADTEGPAFELGVGAVVAFEDGLIWRIKADNAVIGNLDFEPNHSFQPPAFANPNDGDYALRATSAGLDLGIFGKADPDGTAADAGMYGGPDAWELEDLDGDGYVHGRDCVDVNPRIHENAIDRFYDGIDSNCDGASDYDQDGDGFDSSMFGGTDCNDANPAVYPGAVESGGDLFDEDCDGFDYPDLDADGWPSDLDCDDTNGSIAPDAKDPWYDGIDQDCAGNDDFDQDGDGYQSSVYGGRDCDDRDPHRHPMYPDFPGDGIDQDCDGQDAVAEQETEDEVSTLRPDEDHTVSPFAPAAMGEDTEGSAVVVSTGCSATGTAGSWALGLLAVFGLVGRRRD